MKFANKVVRAALLALAMSCSAPAVTPPQLPPPAADGTGPAASAVVAAPSAPEPLPDDLAAMLPPASVYLELKDVQKLLAPDGLVAKAMGADPVEAIVAQIPTGKLPREVAAAALRSVDALAVVSSKGKASAMVVRLTNGEPVEAALRAQVAEDLGTAPRGGHRYGLGKIEVDWFPAARVLVVGNRQMTAAIADVLEGRRASMAEAPKLAAARAKASGALLLVMADPSEIFAEKASIRDALFADGDPLVLSLSADLAAPLVAEARLSGTAITSLPPQPAPLDLAARLPAETVGWLSYSSRSDRAGDERFQELFGMLGAFDDRLAALPALLPLMWGVSGGELMNTLGTQGVLAVVAGGAAAKAKKATEFGATVWIQELSSDTAAKTFDPLLKTLEKKGDQKYRVRRDARGLTAEPKDPKSDAPYSVLRFIGDHGLLAAGDKKTVERIVAAFEKGQDTLGSAAPTAPAGTRAELAVRLDRIMPLVAARMPGADSDALVKLAAALGPAVIRYASSAEGRGVRMRLETGMAGAAGIGALSAVAIYGVRRYLAAAKTSEAKNTVGSIGRAAQAAFEREEVRVVPQPGQLDVQGIHTLCQSAQSVPAVVPSGIKYHPSSAPGTDYDTGDDHTGWKCLRFAVDWPHYYRYSYHVGSGYLGPARGGPNPGPNGFEVAAEGDLDGDGKTSLFTLTGKIDAKGSLVITRELFIADELE
jgi:hypothetical protein